MTEDDLDYWSRGLETIGSIQGSLDNIEPRLMKLKSMSRAARVAYTKEPARNPIGFITRREQ